MRISRSPISPGALKSFHQRGSRRRKLRATPPAGEFAAERSLCCYGIGASGSVGQLIGQTRCSSPGRISTFPLAPWSSIGGRNGCSWPGRLLGSRRRTSFRNSWSLRRLLERSRDGGWPQSLGRIPVLYPSNSKPPGSDRHPYQKSSRHRHHGIEKPFLDFVFVGPG